MKRGLPYARDQRDKQGWFRICPICVERIDLVERKDFESFTGAEYINHFDVRHGARSPGDMKPCTWDVFACRPGQPESHEGTVEAVTFEEAFGAAQRKFGEYVNYVHARDNGAVTP